MCVGIPVKVESVDGFIAKCQSRNGLCDINTMLVGEVEVGDWLLTFLDQAREKIDEERAVLITSALDSLDSIMSGKDNLESKIENSFADIISGENRLPPHLQHLDKGNQKK